MMVILREQWIRGTNRSSVRTLDGCRLHCISTELNLVDDSSHVVGLNNLNFRNIVVVSHIFDPP